MLINSFVPILSLLVFLYIHNIIKLYFSISISSYNPLKFFIIIHQEFIRKIFNYLLLNKQKYETFPNFLLSILLVFISLWSFSLVNQMRENENQLFLSVFILLMSSASYGLVSSFKNVNFNLLELLEKRCVYILQIILLIIATKFLEVSHLLVDTILSVSFYFMCLWILFEAEFKTRGVRKTIQDDIYLVLVSSICFVSFLSEIYPFPQIPPLVSLFVFYTLFVAFYFFQTKKRSKPFLNNYHNVRYIENYFISSLLGLRFLFWVV